MITCRIQRIVIIGSKTLVTRQKTKWEKERGRKKNVGKVIRVSLNIDLKELLEPIVRSNYSNTGISDEDIESGKIQELPSLLRLNNLIRCADTNANSSSLKE